VATNVKYADVEVGEKIPEQDFPVQRLDLVKYAGASGDFNIIHWNERAATKVGLPNVIAHGMFTMATAVRVVTDLPLAVGFGISNAEQVSELGRQVEAVAVGSAIVRLIEQNRDNPSLEIQLESFIRELKHGFGAHA